VRIAVTFTHSIRTLVLVPALMVAVAPGVRAQHSSAPPVVVPSDRSGLGEAPADGDEASARLARDMAKKANSERQAALKNDTEKLLKLAVELKASVDKSNENLLSMDVVKKAEEIEKLAHSVKDKMKGPN
jgi:nitric oxide reductase activation protein